MPNSKSIFNENFVRMSECVQELLLYYLLCTHLAIRRQNTQHEQRERGDNGQWNNFLAGLKTHLNDGAPHHLKASRNALTHIKRMKKCS